ncbi:Sodium/hydrogen exchanger 7 [Mizuhopecten yessoensis]|uniref:Sodium/hydrogen exchanger n=1 Tax=Mizuhopecten yessoensis TaxID=6573 RepID=A0A210QUB8_MIZYE|nr:Sodium/hydrogen exchanger 7 [Mizuhopecten yessoensis]
MSVASEEEEQVLTVHKTDSATILILLGILLLTILTIWLFKHRRLRFVHESGLSMIYGMIVGMVIRYGSSASTETPEVELTNNETFYAFQPPSSVILNLKTEENSTDKLHSLKYNLWGMVNENEQMAPIVRAVTFDPEFFFNIMLPFIIFEAGYSMKRRHFFRNFGAIIAYAFVGTTISCCVVGGIMYGLTRLMDITFTLNDCFFFGAIISATDPVTVLAIFSDLRVDVDLFALIFGESVLNDAVAIVLSESVETYGQYASTGFSVNALFKSLGSFVGIFAGAFAIGSFIGCLTAVITKYTKIRDFPLLETALFFLMSYSTFQAAEAAGLTGIVAVLFCGITQAHYTFNNLSVESKQRTKQLFELTNFLAENFVFLYVGVSIFTFHAQKWHAGFIFSTFLAIFVARFCNVYPLSLLLNLGRRKKIKSSFMNMMMFSGLRGAIAFALSIRNTSSEARRLMVSSTMMVVLVTVVICGGFTTPMLQWLQIRVGVEEDQEVTDGSSIRTEEYLDESSMPELPESPLLEGGSTVEISQGKKPRDAKAWLVAQWHSFDVRFMKPFLTHCRPTLMDTSPACCMPLARILTTVEQLQGSDPTKDADSDIDMIIDHRELSIGEDTVSTVSQSQPYNSTEPVSQVDVWVHSQVSLDDPPLTP